MIKLNDISKVFGTKTVIDKISLNIKQGEIFGIIGLSGAGKSTLLRIVNGLEKCDGGTVELADNVKFGFVFQNFNLVNSLTVADNIRLALINEKLDEKQIEEKVDEVLKLVGLDAYKQAKPNKLSGGQKQRVGIARSLAADVNVLLCDEATSALDPFTASEIIKLLDKLNKELNLTIVFVSHQLEIVRDFCDRIAIVDSGKLCEVGKVIDVFSKPKSPISLKLLSKVLGFDNQLEHKEIGLITCYSRKDINDCLKVISSSDVELLSTYQHQTKQGIFAHIFVNQNYNIDRFEVRRIHGL